MTDEQLLRGLQNAQQDALEALMRKYYRYIYTVIANTLGSAGGPEDVKELVQDTFYAVWRSADSIHGRLRPYLSTTARNRAVSFLRTRRELPMCLDMIDIPDPGGSLEDAAQQRELTGMIQSAINRMRPKDREIFFRHYYYVQTAEEIAVQMGISPNVVRTRLSRGRKILKKTLSKEEFR